MNTTPLTDPFNRRLTYLRLSVTDLCNYKCSYCLPEGYQGKANPDELSVAEIAVLAEAFAQSGTRKIRITGGEATLRRDLPDIIAACRAQPEIESIALTTNAYHLSRLFPAYRAAGLDKINVSIDSFHPETFRKITGKDECLNIQRDIDTMLEQGFTAIKANTLLLREYAEATLPDALAFIKTRPIILRFIELMQTGGNEGFFNNQHLSAAQIENRLISEGWQLLPRRPRIHPSRLRRRHRLHHPIRRRLLPLLQPPARQRTRQNAPVPVRRPSPRPARLSAHRRRPRPAHPPARTHPRKTRAALSAKQKIRTDTQPVRNRRLTRIQAAEPPAV